MHADLLTSRGMPALHTIAGLQADNSLRRETEFTVHVHEGCRHHRLPVEGCAHALDVRRHTASTSGKRIVKLSRAAARQGRATSWLPQRLLTRGTRRQHQQEATCEANEQPRECARASGVAIHFQGCSLQPLST